MKIAPVAAATQPVSRRKGAKQSPGDRPGEGVLRPVRGHALGCARSPKAHLERLLGPFLPLMALIPLPASVPAHAELSEVGVASLRLLPARSPPRQSTPHHTRTRARAAWAGRRSPSSLLCRLLCVRRHKNPSTGLRIGTRTRRWAGGAGAPFRCLDVRLAGEDVCTPTRPGLQRRGLASSAKARCASSTQTGIPSPARGAICSEPEPSRAPRRMRPPSGRPAPSNTLATLTVMPARKVTLTGKAVSK